MLGSKFHITFYHMVSAPSPGLMRSIQFKRESVIYFYALVVAFHRENSTDIQLLHNIDSDELVYREELVQEQAQLREQMVRSLELQHKNSLSARFARRQNTTEQREACEERWRQIQVGIYIPLTFKICEFLIIPQGISLLSDGTTVVVIFHYHGYMTSLGYSLLLVVI